MAALYMMSCFCLEKLLQIIREFAFVSLRSVNGHEYSFGAHFLLNDEMFDVTARS